MPQGFRFATHSITGRRKENQDSVMAEAYPEDGLLLAVADGMGGHAAGEVASALALETLLKALQAGESLEKAAQMANWRVHKKAQDPGLFGMGTTLTALHLVEDRFHIVNVGDSRAYRLSRRGIRQLTDDHSFVAEAMKRGQSEDAAMASPWKDALTRSIGGEEEVEVDVFGPFPVENDTAILICSDGLYKTLRGGEMRRIFLASESPEDAAEALVSAAYAKGSDDNITVAILEFGQFQRRRSEEEGQGKHPPHDMERRGAQDVQIEVQEAVEPGGGPAGKGEVERTIRRAREVVGPWELDGVGTPGLVGGPKPGRRLRIGFLAVVTILVGAIAALLLFG